MKPTDEQPAPVNEVRVDNPAVWPLILAEVTDRLVVADMAERDAMGRARYGVPLAVWNGRDPVVDAYQEVLDAIVYLRQACERMGPMPSGWSHSPQYVLKSLERELVGVAKLLRHDFIDKGVVPVTPPEPKL
jgi:hypothetical protein